ncbi:MAG: serine/threonine protein kinase [Phycisphaerales bacterium]|nr:serine/threonine protein kinase [Phycisphaerales bacterium]
MSSPLSHFESAKPGTTLAGFDVLAKVGEGAASFVYVVMDPKTKQIKALKHVIKHDKKDQRFLDQAESEYNVAQKVKSQHIRNIERIIKTREKLISVRELFLVMEYVDGVSLERLPPDSVEQAIQFFIQAAEGLGHMHRCGFVHADMKPNNIIRMSDGTVKIIDLGQACAIGTKKERIQGTPDYIAPEQVHRREITPATDIYNLGATMYWVLTKKNIPTAMSGKGDSLVEGLDGAMIARPKPAHEINGKVPPALSELINDCVEPEPENRPATMDAVMERLGRVLREMRDAAKG